MATWIVDTTDKVAEQVIPTAECHPLDKRFRKVSADSLQQAIECATFESVALNKMAMITNGGQAIMSDKELDWLIDIEFHPTSVVSIINPNRMGLLDRYLVALKDHPTIAAHRQRELEAYEAQPAIQAYRQQAQALSA